MLVKKTLLVSVLAVCCYNMFSIKAADDKDTGDKELMSKLFTVVLKCFKDADWGVCGDMLKSKYDVADPKVKQCTCDLACTGEELELINSSGEPVPAKFMEYVNHINNPTIKSEMQKIYDKCESVKGADKCALSENFASCALKASPALKDRMSMLIDTLVKMKSK